MSGDQIGRGTAEVRAENCRKLGGNAIFVAILPDGPVCCSAPPWPIHFKGLVGDVGAMSGENFVQVQPSYGLKTAKN